MSLLAGVLGCACLGCSVCEEPLPYDILAVVNISNNAGNSLYPAAAGGPDGTIHVFWTDNTPGLEQGSEWNQEILYSYRSPGGQWSVPENVSRNERASRFPAPAVGPDSRLHLVWQDASPDGRWRLFYSSKLPGGGWVVPETLSGSHDYVDPEVAVGADGVLHVVWKWGGYYSKLRYASRDTNGTWSGQVDLAAEPFSGYHNVLVDRAGAVHVAYRYSTIDFTTSDILYLSKTRGGEWSCAVNVSGTGDVYSAPGLAVDDELNTHLAWRDGNASQRGGFYRRLSADGVLGEREYVFPYSLGMTGYPRLMVLGPDDELQVVVARGLTSPYEDWRLFALVSRPLDGAWSDTSTCGVVEQDPYDVILKAAVQGPDGVIHLIGDKTPDPDNLGKHDVYWIEVIPKRR